MRVLEDTDRLWYTDGLQFSCNRCGNCCSGPSGYVWFNDEEAQAMASFLGITEAAFRKCYARRKYGKWTLAELRRNGAYDCVFLDRDEQGQPFCSIYTVRPLQCRTWPFWPENIESPRSWREAGKRCGGINRPGCHFDCETIQSIAGLHED